MSCKLFEAGALVTLWLSASVASSQSLGQGSRAGEAAADGAAGFRIVDPFDDTLALNWEPLNPDPSHHSLAKHPGNLTITTQRGTMHRKDAPSAKPPIRNVFLLDNPAQQGAGFVATTCLKSFHPTTPWHQAGLIVFDDEDNYMKFALESNHRARMQAVGPGPIWCVLREVDGESKITRKLVDVVPIPTLWLRLTLRGKLYEYASSTDGEHFTVHGNLPWGDGSPAKVGIVAGNGGSRDAAEIDARFDFFELRSLTREEAEEPRILERKRLAGQWGLKSCQIDGNEIPNAPLSQIVFTENNLTIAERGKSFETEYTLDIADEPKVLTMSSFLGHKDRQIKASYVIDGDALTICFALRPQADAPSEFKTERGDGRMLLKLERVPSE